MPLRGNLQNLRLGDVLQTVLASGGRGLLRVRSGTRRAVLHLSDRGLRVLEPEVLDDRMVLDAFVRRGAVQPEVLERARRLAGKGGDGSVLETLLIGGSIDRQPFDALLGEAAEDAVLDVLAWSEGDFVFDEGAEPARSPGRVAEVSLDPSGLLLRAAQRLDEHAQLTGRIGANALLVMLADGNLRRLAGTPTVVHARLDGQRLLDEIALEAGITLFEARKAAAALVDGGAARVPTGDELAAASTAREAGGDTRGRRAAAAVAGDVARRPGAGRGRWRSPAGRRTPRTRPSRCARSGTSTSARTAPRRPTRRSSCSRRSARATATRSTASARRRAPWATSTSSPARRGPSRRRTSTRTTRPTRPTSSASSSRCAPTTSRHASCARRR
jgi:hypothetical protein